MVDNPDNPDAGVVQDVDVISSRQDSMMARMPYGDVISKQTSQTTEPISSRQAADRWKNRRRMAYISLAAIILATIGLFFFVPQERLDSLQEPVGWFYISMASIVGAYCGFATMDDKWRGSRSGGSSRYND